MMSPRLGSTDLPFRCLQIWVQFLQGTPKAQAVTVHCQGHRADGAERLYHQLLPA
jgi:hypothetical protein